MKVDEGLSPALVEKVAYLGTKLPSFRDAHEALDVLLRTKLSLKRVERVTEAIGAERVVQREAETAAWRDLPLMQRDRTPEGVKAPALAAVLADGGRLQLCVENSDARVPTSSSSSLSTSSKAKSHWHEYKAGVLHILKSQEHTTDPCETIPPVYLQADRIDKLSREITTMAASIDPAGPVGEASTLHESSVPLASKTAPLVLPEEIIPHGYDPPEVVDRDVVATRHKSDDFGEQLAARAWHLGLFAATRKAFIGDGSSWIWTEWGRHFKAFGFVPILDFIHALTRVYAAAMAGRSKPAGWKIYQRWITWIWQGEVTKVIAELAQRQQELGPPTTDDGDTNPRRIVSESLTYLQNQQSRMQYHEYRRAGLPITSAHMESTVKLINRRLKGSEKYWSEPGAEDLLQLTADHLSTSGPLTAFWQSRPHQQTGLRKPAKHAA